MRKVRIIGWFCALTVLLFGPLLAQEVEIVFSGQTHGMLYPCNCPVRQDGGVSRRATLIKKLRKKNPELLLLDCGNFTAGGQFDEYTQNSRLDMARSEVNYRALELMRYDAVGVGADEFNFGRDFFLKSAKKSNPVYLSANLGSSQVLPYLLKTRAGVKIALIGLTALSANQKSEGLNIAAWEIAGHLVERLRKEGAQVVIVLSTLGEKEDLKLLATIKGIDLVFVGDRPLKQDLLEKVGEAYLVRPAWQGRKLGKLVLKIQNDRLLDCQAQDFDLTDDLKNDPQIQAILPECFCDHNCQRPGLTGVCRNPGTFNADCSFKEATEINLTVIGVRDCLTCDTQGLIDTLKKRFLGLKVTYLEYPDLQAKEMIDDLEIRMLPAYILPKSLEQESNFSQIKNDLRQVKDFYVFKPRVSGVSYFLGQTSVPGKLDVFFSLFDKNAGDLLTALREFRPALHFLVFEKSDGFASQNGLPETEECLRAVCVEKHCPQEYWDYLSCRVKNIRSSYWEDCLSPGEVIRVKNCARSQEGADLLKANLELVKRLEIASGPSYLMENQEIFASRGVPQKELKAIFKKKKIQMHQ